MERPLFEMIKYYVGINVLILKHAGVIIFKSFTNIELAVFKRRHLDGRNRQRTWANRVNYSWEFDGLVDQIVPTNFRGP